MQPPAPPAPAVRRRPDLPAALLAPVVTVAYHVVITGLRLAAGARRRSRG